MGNIYNLVIIELYSKLQSFWAVKVGTEMKNKSIHVSNSLICQEMFLVFVNTRIKKH